MKTLNRFVEFDARPIGSNLVLVESVSDFVAIKVVLKYSRSRLINGPRFKCVQVEKSSKSSKMNS